GLSANLTIAYANNGVNAGHSDNVTQITLVPACGAFAASENCPAANLQPGIFTLSSSGIGSNCGGGSTLTTSEIDAASGKVSFTPGFVLAPDAVCVISYTFSVNALPTQDADSSRSGIQVAVLGAASATDATTGAPGGGLGTAEISFPQITTTP